MSLRLGNATDPHGSVCFGWCCGGHRHRTAITEAQPEKSSQKALWMEYKHPLMEPPNPLMEYPHP
jgi:hypothetical protein